jgi:hypothetical protein
VAVPAVNVAVVVIPAAKAVVLVVAAAVADADVPIIARSANRANGKKRSFKFAA